MGKVANRAPAPPQVYNAAYLIYLLFFQSNRTNLHDATLHFPAYVLHAHAIVPEDLYRPERGCKYP